MPSRARPARPAMYNTPAIRNGGFGALQVEAVTNRPLSIARRHLAASQLRMRDIEPDELSSSEWVRFLVMEETERDRWMTQFVRRRRNSDESSSSAELDRDTQHSKEDEARLDAADARGSAAGEGSSSRFPAPTGTTPAVSLWARQMDGELGFDGGGGGSGGTGGEAPFSQRRPMHTRRAVTVGEFEAPPTYDSVVRARTPPPAYEPRSDDDEPASPREVRRTIQIP